MSEIIHELRLSHAKVLARKKWKKKRAAENWLQNRGFRRLGGESKYGSAWTDDNKIVVKLFSDDPCYMQFVDFCRANRGDPHLPRITRVYPFDEHSGVVFLEHLAPFTDRVTAYCIGNYFRVIREKVGLSKLTFQWMQENPSIVQTLNKIHKAIGKSCQADIHEGNIMQRGSTLVIIDPVAPYNTI